MFGSYTWVLIPEYKPELYPYYLGGIYPGIYSGTNPGIDPGINTSRFSYPGAPECTSYETYPWSFTIGVLQSWGVCDGKGAEKAAMLLVAMLQKRV